MKKIIKISIGVVVLTTIVLIVKFLNKRFVNNDIEKEVCI